MESNLYAHEIGSGLPVLIIHGWTTNGKVEEADFEPIFSNIPGLLRIYVDLPGMGATPADGIHDQDDIMRRLEQFIDHRLQKSKFLLIGSSCGAYLAHHVAQAYSKQVDGLLLRVPMIEAAVDKRDLDDFEPVVEDATLISSMSSEDKTLLGNILVQTPTYIDALKTKYETVYVPALKQADSKVLGPLRSDPKRYALSRSTNASVKFGAPTLIVCGRQDQVVGYRDSQRWLELYPRSTYIVLDRAGHELPLENTGVFEALVRDWIFRVQEWRDHVNDEQ